jgi:hypothetical protein
VPAAWGQRIGPGCYLCPGTFHGGIDLRDRDRLEPISLMVCRALQQALDLDQGPGGFEELFRATTAYNRLVCRYLAKPLSMLSIEGAGLQARVIHRLLDGPARVPFLYDTMHHAGQRQIASGRLWESS